VDLGANKMVIGHYEAQNTTRVVAQDPKNPEYGTIELVFLNDPITLAQWIITDDLGNRTTVVLDRMVLGGDLPSSLFNITIEAQKRAG
jgi:outer membrane lipoprotein-sorting protein